MTLDELLQWIGARRFFLESMTKATNSEGNVRYDLAHGTSRRNGRRREEKETSGVLRCSRT